MISQRNKLIRERGVAMIEMAIIIPTFVLFIFVIVQFALWMQQRTMTHRVLDVAARRTLFDPSVDNFRDMMNQGLANIKQDHNFLAMGMTCIDLSPADSSLSLPSHEIKGLRFKVISQLNCPLCRIFGDDFASLNFLQFQKVVTYPLEDQRFDCFEKTGLAQGVCQGFDKNHDSTEPASACDQLEFH